MKGLLMLMFLVVGVCSATTMTKEAVVYFRDGKANVDEAGKRTLDEVIMEAPDGATIIANCFASEKSYKKLEGGNNALSEWRASEIKSYILANMGTKTFIVIARGHGVLGAESAEKARRAMITIIQPEIRVDVVTKVATVTVPVIQTVIATATETKIATVTVPVIQTVTATSTATVEVKLFGTVTIVERVRFIDDEEVFPEQLKERSKWGVGVNYPGLGIKYRVSKKNTVELRTQIGKDVFVIGPRFYRSIYSMGTKTAIYAGGEVDYFTFKGEVSKGSGFVLGGFAGLEYPVSPNVGLGVDFGPAFISLKDKATGESDSGIDLIMNIGLTYYFRGGEKK